MLTLQKFKVRPKAKVCAIGDLHLGSKAFRRDQFENTVKEIKNQSEYVILMGDLYDLILAGDKRRDEYAVDPDFRIFDNAQEYLIETLKPIKRNILGILFGNHEQTLKKSGIDVIAGLTDSLQCAYMGYLCHIEFQIGSHKSHLLATHGRTGARFRATRTNAALRMLDRFGEVVDSDHDYRSIAGVLYAHTHDTFVYDVPSKNVPDFKHKKILHRRNFAALTGTFSEAGQIEKDDYAITAEYEPMPCGYVKIHFGEKIIERAEAIVLDTPFAY